MNKIVQALTTAYKRDHEGVENVVVEVNEEKRDLKMFVQKEIVEEVENPGSQISLEEARRISAKYELGGMVRFPVENVEFGRIAAGNGKQVIIQGLREAEHGMIYDEWGSKQHEILTGTVSRIDPRSGNVYLRIGTGNEATVPEIFDGTVEIRSIAREAGSRTKMAVWSADENVDPIGACVGPRGQRVAAIVEELHGEKIDIIKYSEDPAEFIAAALAPSDVEEVRLADEGKVCRVIVPDDQLSLAIGKEGQNARLAARLTGYKIDIKPASYQESEEASEPPAEETPEEF